MHSEMISAIRASFPSLLMRDLAIVLDTPREVIYSWIRGDEVPTTDQAVRLRVAYLVSLAAREEKPNIGGIRELARKNGINLNYVLDQEGELDLVTGKRNSME